MVLRPMNHAVSNKVLDVGSKAWIKQMWRKDNNMSLVLFGVFPYNTRREHHETLMSLGCMGTLGCLFQSECCWGEQEVVCFKAESW